MCKNLILKHEKFLKEVFIGLISTSSYPAITALTMANFLTKIKIFEGKFEFKDLGRIFSNNIDRY